MLGGAGLTRSATAARMASMRLTALRSNRSLSSVASRYSRHPVSLGKGFPGITVNASWKPVASASGLSFARFNSTSTTAAADENAADAAFQAGSTDIADLSPLEIEQIPEKIGYLKELGLDYGWGPSSMMEWMIEHTHMWTGLPWWASLVATGLLVRLALLQPSIMASDNASKVQAIRGQSEPLRQRMTYHARDGNSMELAKARAEMQELHRQHGIKAWKSVLPMLQIPLGYGCFRVVRGMTSLPVPGLAAESVGWLTDLTVRDPYFLLPVATAVFMYFTFKKGGEAGMNQFSSTAMGKMMLYGLPATTFLFMAWWPSALQLYFATTGLFALGQSYLLNSPGFRQWAGVAPLPRGPQSIPGGGPSGQGSESDRRIRLLEDYIKAEAKKAAREQFKASPTAALKNPISFIDKVVDSVKNNMSNLQKEMSEKVNQVAGQGPTTNADGTPAPPPRLSKNDLQRAESYQKRRQEEEEYKREERNHARREAYLRALEEQREKAARSLRSTKPKTR